MNRLPGRTRPGQYTWLQVIMLAVSVAAYLLGAVPVAVVFLLVGTFFGVLATLGRVKQAQQISRQMPRGRRRS